MTDPSLEPDSLYADQHTLGDAEIPAVVIAMASGSELELVWHNELGGLTFRADDRYIKWNPRGTGVDLDRERVRLEWLSVRHPAPRVLSVGADAEAQWMVTAAMPGNHAVGEPWRSEPEPAIAAIATGLRAIHAVSIDDFPREWADEVWVGRAPESLPPRPPIDQPVLVHGDACAPNTLISPSGEWTGHVDLGDLGIGDRWADLAIASLSLDWNFGEGYQEQLYSAYGIEPDVERIEYYRALWHQES